MLWFNRDKGYGFIRTDAGERLYVAESGFVAGEAPAGKCKGLKVAFDRVALEGDTRAIGVHFVAGIDPPRARRRHPRGGTSL